MPWWIWVALAIGVLAGIGQIVSQHGTASPKSIVRNAQKKAGKAPAETAQETADRLNREFLARIEHEDNMAIRDDGTPNVGWYLREVDRLMGLGREDQAHAILNEGRELCIRTGMIDGARHLDEGMDGIAQALAAKNKETAAIEDILAAITRHPDGILQTVLYKQLPDIETDLARLACWKLAEAGRITREKKGRSYILRVTGTR